MFCVRMRSSNLLFDLEDLIHSQRMTLNPQWVHSSFVCYILFVCSWKKPFVSFIFLLCVLRTRTGTKTPFKIHCKIIIKTCNEFVAIAEI